MRVVLLCALLGLLPTLAFPQTTSSGEFAAAREWTQALQSADQAALKNLYSADPPAVSIGKDKQQHDIAEEITFWQGLKGAGLKDLQMMQRQSGDQQGLHLVELTLSFHVATPEGERSRYVFEDQGWLQEAGAWKIVVAHHSDVVKTAQPTRLNPHLYPENADAKAEIAAAIERAGHEHKRVILIFGANWCYDCHVLDFDLHQGDPEKLVDANFVVVHVDVGEFKTNTDIAEQYSVPLKHGVPALAVLDSQGKLLYSQQNGEFESARTLDPDELVTFLKKWKP